MKWLVRGLAVVLFALLSAGVVSAHAKLIKSEPAPSSVLGRAPSQVQLWFDEPIEPAFSQVQVLDAQRQRVDAARLSLAPGDAKSVVVPLKPLGDGTYSVVWQVLSAADGHITRGVFAFAVGNVAGPAPAPVDTSVPPAAGELTPFSATARWISLLSLLALVGGLFFKPFLLDRSLEGIDAGQTAGAAANRRWHQLTLLVLVLFATGTLAEFAVQAQLVTDQLSVTSLLNVLLGTRFGTLWLLRSAFVALCALLVFGLAPRLSMATIPYITLGVGAASLYTRSLSSHSAASGNLSLAVLADWLHLVAISLWVGGLIYFAFLMPFLWRTIDPRRRSAWIASLVPRFSRVAIGATVVIAVTGVYSSVQQIPSLDLLATRQLPTLEALVGSQYDKALFIKVGLFLVMVAFGAVNLLVLSPRFRLAIGQPAQSTRLFTRFRLTVAGEVLLGASAVFLAAILTLTVPPRSEPTPGAPVLAQNTAPRPVVLLGSPAPGVQVQLQVGPQPAAPTLFDARVTDAQGNPLADLQRVIFNFMYLDQDTGAQNVNGDARPDAHYVAEGNLLALDGMWRIRVTVRRKGVDDVAVEFPYYISPSTQGAGGGTPGSGEPADARVILQQAQARMNLLKSLRSRQELNDGANGVAVSLYEYQAPDRTRFRIEGQGESIAIGDQQYYQDTAGAWTERARVESFRFPNYDFATTAQVARMGRLDSPGGVAAQLVLFQTPSTSGADVIRYAYWLAQDDHRLLQFGMVTTDHYMMQYYYDPDAPEIDIRAPANVSAAPTPAGPAGGSGALTTFASPARPRGWLTGDLEGDGALVMVVVGIVVLLVGSGAQRVKKARLAVLGLGAASIVAGILLFVDAVNATTALATSAPVNTARAASGQQVYQQNCQACHGEKGYGDGPGGAFLPVKPFDLTTHVLLHDEQYLHAVILNGRGYMPAFGSKLSQDQILDVIAYIRQLARQAQQQPNAPGRGFTPQP